jgi:RsiW-degrading membrane proteinase PrsW (M82 family)
MPDLPDIVESFLGAILIALVPALVVMFYYYHRDRHPEPWRRVALVFVFGLLSCALVYPLERLAQELLGPAYLSRRRMLIECLVVPGLIEETVKLLVVVAAVWRCPDFDEPVDGLIYGVAAALGFTFGEDLRYYLVHGFDGSRLISTVAHPWFSSFWASSLGWALVLPRLYGFALVVLGLVCSIVVHALFDFFIIAADANHEWAWLRHLLVPHLVFMYWVMEKQLESLQPAQPPSLGATPSPSTTRPGPANSPGADRD